jgi:hypothetical protein
MAQNSPKKIIKGGYLHTRVNYKNVYNIKKYNTCIKNNE